MENLVVAVKKLKNGETILKEGSWAFYAYILRSGKAKVFKQVHDKQVQVGALKAGDIFGEMAFLGSAQRTATVVADGDAEVGEIPLHNFSQAVSELPKDKQALLESMVSDLACISEASSVLLARMQDIQNIKTKAEQLKKIESQLKDMPEIIRQVATSLVQRLTAAVDASVKMNKVLEEVVHSVDMPSASLIKKS